MNEVERLTRELAAANRLVDELREALAACEVSMDTAAMHGVDDILPPAYRDAWAERHWAAIALLARLRVPT